MRLISRIGCITALFHINLLISYVISDRNRLDPSINILASLKDFPSTWADWWEYDKSSDRGPDHWGIANPDWRICRDGKFQSPIDIPSTSVRFDPQLSQSLLYVSGSRSVYGELRNTGQELQFVLDPAQSGIVSLDGGPLAYTYRLSHIKLRYGPEEAKGSEHSIDGYYFEAEMQLFFYNDYLFLSFEAALGAANGIVALSVFIQENDNDTNNEFQKLFHGLNKVSYKGLKKDVEGIDVSALLPDTYNYITYQGSLTAPPCSEGVTWILYNRPINIPKWQIRNLRSKIARNEPPPPDLSPDVAGIGDLPMMGNTRPIQATNRRLSIWTNVRSRMEQGKGPVCATSEPSAMKYSINTMYKRSPSDQSGDSPSNGVPSSNTFVGLPSSLSSANQNAAAQSGSYDTSSNAFPQAAVSSAQQQPQFGTDGSFHKPSFSNNAPT